MFIAVFKNAGSAFVLIATITSTTRAETLRVDIGHKATASSKNDVQPDFEDFAGANTNGSVMGRAAAVFSETFSTALGVGGAVTVTIDASKSASTTLAFRDRGDMSGPQGDLAEDFAFNEDRLTLTLKGLKAGTYAMTTWHHDPSYVGGRIDIQVGSRTVVGSLTQTTGRSQSPARAAFPLHANEADPVVIRFLSQSRDDAFVAYLNGFVLTRLTALAAFDVDASNESNTQKTGGVQSGPFAALQQTLSHNDALLRSAADRDVTIRMTGAGPVAAIDRGANGELQQHPLANLLRDFVLFDSARPDNSTGPLTIDLAGLKAQTTYLLTWYGYDSDADVTAPMFVYQGRVSTETLSFTNVDDFLYTKANDLRFHMRPQTAAHSFLATSDRTGVIRLIAGRGATAGSDSVDDGPTATYFNGLTVSTLKTTSHEWQTAFGGLPKFGTPTAVNPQGDSLTKDYSTEVELVPPTEPEAAEATFEVEPGFRVQLVAAEPLVIDPVGMSFDERGRLFVSEMRGYNQGNRVPASEARALAMSTKKLGRVRLLEDTDGDGRFDKSSVYVEDLIWPNGVMAYDGGVFVSAAPDLLFCKDTDGDGKADIRRVVLTGFGYSNWQHLPNSFRWGLDNRIHGASGSGGGVIQCPLRPDDKPVLIRGRDFAFDPRTLQLAPTNSSAQFGLTFDDWGNKYLTSNSDHILQVFFPDRYISRNPYLAAPRSWRLIAAEGRGADVFRISAPEPHRVVWMRMRATGVIKGIIERGGAPTGYVTAAGGTTIYRGDAWPAQYRGDSFTPECSGNLLHRNKLEPNGVGQIARRVDSKREFLASRDIWFRPVNMANGPDGNLYMADMYRQVINEGVVLPPNLRKRFDLTEGCELGRIYRVLPKDWTSRPVPDLGKAPTAELVALLEHPNCWHHTTAARLLYHRQDRAAIEPLTKMAAQSPSPLARMRALYALDGLETLETAVVLPRLADPHPRVREHAVRLSESVLKKSPAVRDKLCGMRDDEDLRVRYQLAFTLGEISGPQSTDALAAVAARDGADQWIRLAILSSSLARCGDLFAQLAPRLSGQAAAARQELLQGLAQQVGRENQPDQIERFLIALDAQVAGAPADHKPPPSGGSPTADPRRWKDEPLIRAIVLGLIRGLDAANSPLRHRLASRSNSVAGRVLADIVKNAEEVATDPDQAAGQRAEAARSLGFASFDEASPVLSELLDGRQPQTVGLAAIETLSRFQETQVAGVLIDAWPALTPQLRSSATGVLFANRRRLAQLLKAIESEDISRSQLDPARLQALESHPDAQIRQEATKLLKDLGLSRREDVLTAYRTVLEIDGNAERGREVFRKECASCHRLEGVGYDLGLPLNAIKDRGKEGILMNVLDPNSNINPEYLNYIIVTTEGRVLTGMIAAESANSITLKRGDGESDIVLRADIDELVATDLSVMPEGLEKQVSKQNMTDLIAYLMSVQ